VSVCMGGPYQVADGLSRAVRPSILLRRFRDYDEALGGGRLLAERVPPLVV